MQTQYTQTQKYVISSMQRIGEAIELLGKTTTGQSVKFQAPLVEAKRFRVGGEVTVTIAVAQ